MGRVTQRIAIIKTHRSLKIRTAIRPGFPIESSHPPPFLVSYSWARRPDWTRIGPDGVGRRATVTALRPSLSAQAAPRPRGPRLYCRGHSEPAAEAGPAVAEPASPPTAAMAAAVVPSQMSPPLARPEEGSRLHCHSSREWGGGGGALRRLQGEGGVGPKRRA